MSALFALASAASFGVSDFIGGYASKSLSATRVAFRGTAAAVVIATIAWLVSGGEVTTRDTWFGAAAGIAGIIGLVFLFKALAIGPMATVSPVTAIVGAIVPFSTGLIVGERPATTAVVGAVLGLVAVPLVSGIDRPSEHRPASSTVAMAVVAGIGFGGFFALVGQVSAEAGLWPLVPAKLTALAVLGFIIVLTKAEADPAPVAAARWAYVSGSIDLGANVFFLLAVTTGLLSIAGVISSLYPAFTVALGRIVLKERLTVVQMAGVILIVVALALIAV